MYAFGSAGNCRTWQFGTGMLSTRASVRLDTDGGLAKMAARVPVGKTIRSAFVTLLLDVRWKSGGWADACLHKSFKLVPVEAVPILICLRQQQPVQPVASQNNKSP